MTAPVVKGVVSEICGRDLLEGTSCTIKLKTKNNDRPYEIRWVHLSSDAVIHRKNGKIKKSTPGLTMEEDGSLTFQNVSLKNTGKYKYTFYASDGTETSGEEEIKVYEKAPNPTLTMTINCKDKNATLFCDFGNRTDLTVSWYKDNIIQNKNNPELLLISTHIQENKTYSCSVSNPASSEQSNSVTVSCEGDPGPRKLFSPDFWVLVSILAGGGALLLLLICILIICACQNCSQLKKAQTRRSKGQTQWAWRQASERLLLTENKPKEEIKCPKGEECPKQQGIWCPRHAAGFVWVGQCSWRKGPGKGRSPAAARAPLSGPGRKGQQLLLAAASFSFAAVLAGDGWPGILA
uniref:Ig-like domain-containing protein n=1 Tax=Cyprinus carpio TaxID=7962 RepID=A0A8C2G0K9_CYPCA